MLCFTCGYPIDGKHKFCANCGAGINAPAKEPGLEEDASAETVTNAPKSIQPEEPVAAAQGFEAEMSAPEPKILPPPKVLSFPEDSVPLPKTLNLPEDSVPLPKYPPETRTLPPVHEYYAHYENEGQNAANPYIANREQRAEPEITEEKYFFGKGALVFCLTVIGILSVTAAMFMGLYFNEIGGIL